LRAIRAAIILCAAVLATRCASTPSQTGARGAPCERGTLGLEAGPITRELRRKLALPPELRGAVVTEVLPGGPAAAAGMLPNDIVQEIGGSKVANDCDFIDAAFSRSCVPVRVVFLRDGARVEAEVTPAAQAGFLEKDCGQGLATACFREAWLLWGRNRDTDRERALELFDKACQSGSAEACAQGGLHLTDSAEKSGSALPMLERSCEHKSGSGCASLAFLYATGKLVKKDDHRAVQLYGKACDLGDLQGCYNVGLMANDGRGGPRDLARAAAKYQEACDMGSSPACTNLGFLFEHGTGVKKDSARAVALYQRGCDGTSCEPSNLLGCVNLGRAYRDGIGVAKDEEKAASFFGEACDRKPDPIDGEAAGNSSRACSLLGALYLWGDGVAKDPEKGLALSELGCERGDSFGCFNAAAVYTDTDSEKAASFLDKACSGGDGEGCYDLAIAYEKGSGVTADRRRAAELRRKACSLGFQKACGKK
jgi:TPR repeat protein